MMCPANISLTLFFSPKFQNILYLLLQFFSIFFFFFFLPKTPRFFLVLSLVPKLPILELRKITPSYLKSSWLGLLEK